MAGYHSGNKFKMICGGNKIKKGICGGNVVYSGASPVTYYVDTDTVYTEEVDSGMSCLEPKSFTPSKSGYTFIGWKEDETANDAVLTEKVMTDNEVTLYAVFQKTITLTLYNGSGTATYETGYRYYNNGAITNPTFTVAQTAISGWTARGWSTATTGDASATYSSISNTAFSADVTLYGLYYQVITLKYVVSGATTSKTGNRYYNSKGVYVNPKFTVTNPTKSGATFQGWSKSSTSTTVSYTTISNLTLTASLTVYSVFKYADATVSPSTAHLVKNEAWCTGLQNIGTFYGAVDTGKYYAAQLTLTFAYCTFVYRGKMVQFYVSDGTNKTRIVYAYNGWTDGDEGTNLGQNLNPTLTFSTSSGSKPIYLTCLTSVYGNGDTPCDPSDGSVVAYNVLVSSIKLLGRTVVG